MSPETQVVGSEQDSIGGNGQELNCISDDTLRLGILLSSDFLEI